MMKIAKHEILSVIFGAIVGFGVPFGILFPLLDRTAEEFEGARSKRTQEFALTQVKPFADDYADFLSKNKKSPDNKTITEDQTYVVMPEFKDKHGNSISQVKLSRNDHENVLAFAFSYDGMWVYGTEIIPFHGEDDIKPKSVQNEKLLENYTTKVSEKLTQVKTFRALALNTVKENARSKEYKKYPLKPELERPKIAGELPTTAEELKEYLRWIAFVEGYKSEGELVDVYGTKIKFTLLKDDLKAISAGVDKKFGTADDVARVAKIAEAEQ